MIIYGWGYFNRRDYGVVRGGCFHCGRRGHLKSYTATRFVTLYFIPLIPLGTHRVIAECPHCRQARIMPLRRWRRLRQTELPRVIAAYESRPDDATAARQALQTVRELQDRALLQRIGPVIHARFRQDATILAQLAATYSHLCLDRAADAAYLEAVDVSGDPELGAEASAHLELQKLPRPPAPNRLLQSLPVLIVPGALLFAAAFFLQKAASTHLQSAWLINGLDRPYSVMLNGTSIALPPHARTVTDQVRFGGNTVAPAPSDPFIAPASFTVAVPWYRRAFVRPVVVVNPDQTAVIGWESNGYAYPRAPENAYNFRPATGRVAHIFTSIDFPFADFPEQISVPENGTVVHRTRVFQLALEDSAAVASLLLSRGLTQDLQNYLRARLRADAGDTTAIFLAASQLPRSEFLELARPHLAALPVELEWHRAAQDVLAHSPEAAELLARYRSWMQTQSENSALLYLLARINEDPAEAKAGLERAARVADPTPYAANALSYHHLLEGDARTALQWSNEALRLAPNEPQFQALRTSALEGLDDFTTLEREAGDPLSAGNRSFATFYQHLYRMARLERADEGRAQIARFLADMPAGTIGPGRNAEATAALESALALGAGDSAGFVTALSRLTDPPWRFQRAVIAGDLPEALGLVGTHPDTFGVLEHLVLYIRFSVTQNPEAAGQLRQAISRLESDNHGESRRWARWLTEGEAPDPAVAAHACLDLEHHFVYMAALAQRFPERAEEYLTRAATMRSKESFYSLALADLFTR